MPEGIRSKSLIDFWNESKSIADSFDPIRIADDGEPDDIMAKNLISTAGFPKTIRAELFPSYGKKEILYGDPADYENLSEGDRAELEREKRIELTELLFAKTLRASIYHGALDHQDENKEYVEAIRKAPPENRGLILHTASFKPLQKLFEVVEPNQLQNKVILAYGSVNVSWGVSGGGEGYRAFYDGLKKSGAKLVLIEAFSFLGDRNKITKENTPKTYAVLQRLNGSIGKTFLKVNVNASEAVRLGQIKKIAGFVLDAYEKVEDKKVLILRLVNFFKTCDVSIESSDLEKIFQNKSHSTELFIQFMHRTFLGGEDYNQMKKTLSEVKSCLIDILGQEKAAEISRPVNIYAGVSYAHQALIADQLPAIVLKELLLRGPGERTIASQCYPVEFVGLKGQFPQYKAVQDSPLFYINLKDNILRENPELSKEEVDSKFNSLVSEYLEYIDTEMADSLQANPSMISDIFEDEESAALI